MRAISPPTAEDMSRSRLVAKPTEYAGRTFRSRTEARWAVFFDALGLAWEYEEHGHDLTIGKRRVSYLPDFYLPDVWGQTGKGVWFEVKGAAPTTDEKKLAQALAKASGVDCYIASGGIPSPSQVTGSRVLLSPGRIDGFHPRARRGVPDSGKMTVAECWTQCECGAIGIQRNGLAGRMGCGTSACGPKTLSVTSRKRRAGEVLQRAMLAGSSARFEHGESGATIGRKDDGPMPVLEGDIEIEHSEGPTPSGARDDGRDALLERLCELLAEADEIVRQLRS